MKAEKKSNRARVAGQLGASTSAGKSNDGFVRVSGSDGFALIFGLFLGLALIKFGNPIILDSKISAPTSLSEFRTYAWPPSWSIWFLIPLAIGGLLLAFTRQPRWPGPRWLWILPLVWFGWQLVSATQTVDRALTLATIWHFAGCVLCFLLGAVVLGKERWLRFLLFGILAAFSFCLVRAVDQKLIEFPEGKRFLIESERAGWTNLPPETVLSLKAEGTIVTTNGVDVANPVILRKYEKGRAFGTLVYPNALAGAILLLFPLSMVLAVRSTRRFRSPIRLAVIGLAAFLGLAGLVWTGSKSGWLIAVVLIGVWLFRLNGSARLKWLLLGFVLILGLSVFAVRFHNYFAAGATSIGARFDYWRAAVQTTLRHPIGGTGPGTFQRPYAELKSPEAEMARLTHNDYLEQFSDSGLVGGISYALWIAGLLIVLGRRVWEQGEPLGFAVFLGLLGWFIQGLSEFGLYIPGLAWIAFTLGGCLLGMVGNRFDKAVPAP